MNQWPFHESGRIFEPDGTNGHFKAAADGAAAFLKLGLTAK